MTCRQKPTLLCRFGHPADTTFSCVCDMTSDVGNKIRHFFPFILIGVVVPSFLFDLLVAVDRSKWSDSILDWPIPGESLDASAIGGWPFGIVACQRHISLSFLFIRRLISFSLS